MVVFFSGARCSLAYGPDDATATPSSLASVKSRMFLLVPAHLGRLRQRAVKRLCVCMHVCANFIVEAFVVQ